MGFRCHRGQPSKAVVTSKASFQTAPVLLSLKASRWSAAQRTLPGGAPCRHFPPSPIRWRIGFQVALTSRAALLGHSGDKLVGKGFDHCFGHAQSPEPFNGEGDLQCSRWWRISSIAVATGAESSQERAASKFLIRASAWKLLQPCRSRSGQSCTSPKSTSLFIGVRPMREPASLSLKIPGRLECECFFPDLRQVSPGYAWTKPGWARYGGAGIPLYFSSSAHPSKMSQLVRG